MFIYVKDSRNSKNPEILQSGRKSGSGIPGKIFYQNLFLFNSEQILLLAFFEKMVISAKKVCFWHFSCAPPSSTKPNCLYNLCSKYGQKILKELDHLQLSTNKNFGKKPDPENPGKIRI